MRLLPVLLLTLAGCSAPLVRHTPADRAPSPLAAATDRPTVAVCLRALW